MGRRAGGGEEEEREGGREGGGRGGEGRGGETEERRTVASSLEVVRPYCLVITTTPTSAHSLVQVTHKCGTAMAVPAL